MGVAKRPPRNRFVALARRVYNPIGFSKGYNFILFFIFCGAMMGFALARFQFVNFYGIFCGPPNGMDHALPGECYYYMVGHEKIGIITHLGCIMPASFLVCFQFVPVIRYKALIFHRINGYTVIILSLVGTAGAIMAAGNAFGGGMDVQTAVGFLAIIFVVALVMGYVNIKRLQLEQHRAWMLRAWFYAGSIITVRLVTFIAASIISSIGTYYQLRECGQVEESFGDFGNWTAVAYPECAGYMAGNDTHGLARVKADVNGSPIELAVAFGVMFGSALWLSIGLHAMGVEIYLHLTPAEFERLRNISYQRQLEAGMKNPGAAGLTVDRFGDSEKWEPNHGTCNDHRAIPVPQEEPTAYQGAGASLNGERWQGNTPQELSQPLVAPYQHPQTQTGLYDPHHVAHSRS